MAAWTILSSRPAIPNGRSRPVRFLDVFPFRRLSPVGSAMDPAVKIDQSLFQSGLVLVPRDAVYSGGGFSL